jgi:hypothetical protein
MNISFKLNHLEHDLFIDYRGLEIRALIINGVIIHKNDIKWNKLFLTFPKVF